MTKKYSNLYNYLKSVLAYFNWNGDRVGKIGSTVDLLDQRDWNHRFIQTTQISGFDNIVYNVDLHIKELW